MKSFSKEYSFDREGDFYPLVVTHLVQHFGLIELMSRAAVDISQGIDIRAPEKLSFEEKKYEGELERIKKIKFPDPVYRLALSSAFSTKKININIQEVVDELKDNYRYLFDKGISTFPSRMLIMSAYELKKEEINIRGLMYDELWQFIYHCRNASAHDGKFYFTNGQPKHLAKWKNIEIHRELEGHNLFRGDKPRDGYLSPADPVILLWDIEQKFFKKK